MIEGTCLRSPSNKITQLRRHEGNAWSFITTLRRREVPLTTRTWPCGQVRTNWLSSCRLYLDTPKEPFPTFRLWPILPLRDGAQPQMLGTQFRWFHGFPCISRRAQSGWSHCMHKEGGSSANTSPFPTTKRALTQRQHMRTHTHKHAWKSYGWLKHCARRKPSCASAGFQGRFVQKETTQGQMFGGSIM